jgi:hypothetical protein
MQSPDVNSTQLHEGIRQIREVSHELRVHLTRTVAEWARFSSSEGDIGYFSDVTDPNARLALHDTGKYFANLAFELQVLDSLDRALEDANKTVSAYDICCRTKLMSQRSSRMN